MTNVEIDITVADVFLPAIEKPKRIKILVGGRGSLKSTFAADMMLLSMMKGNIIGCGREFQNSIDESVHRLLYTEYERLNINGFSHDNNHIYHTSGGRSFYRGLQGHSSESLKSMLTGLDRFWIEEGATLSNKTLKVLAASLRLSAVDVERVKAGEDVKMPEVWITLNRGSSNDPISKRYLKRAEKQLAQTGYYEDDNVMVIQANYQDIPQSIFKASGLEQQRLDDEAELSDAEYKHTWGGGYSDTVDNAIIEPEWFDACIDAHTKLGFEPEGVEVVSHDPADSGDAKAISYRHGSVFLDVQQTEDFDVNTACDWATDYAIDVGADVFIWDGGGLGLSLRRDISTAFNGKHTSIQMFNGSHTAMYKDAIYDPLDGELQKGKSNKEAFFNQRAQGYWLLRDRMYATWLAVSKGRYTNPDDMISFSSSIKDLDNLRSELCRIPRKRNGNNKIQLMSKDEMKKNEIDSPNMSDCCMMSMMVDVDELNMKKRLATQDHAIPTAHTYF